MHLAAKKIGKIVAYEFNIHDIMGMCDECGSATHRMFVLSDSRKAFSCPHHGDDRLVVSSEDSHRHIYFYSRVCEACRCEAHLRSEMCWCEFHLRITHAEKIKVPVLAEIR